MDYKKLRLISQCGTESSKPLPSLDDIERTYIMEVLEFFGNDRMKAAQALKVSHKTLQNKLGRYKVEGHSVPDRRVRKKKCEIAA